MNILHMTIAWLAATLAFADDTVTISHATTDANGFIVHDVISPFQVKVTQIRLLLPDKLDASLKYPVVYVLPVEPGLETKYGDGLTEIKKLDLQNRLSVIFAAPTFSHLPWYADHPSRPDVRQESYFIKVVVPYVDKSYPVRADARGRLLLGFSKSGWGAYSLLLRHPELFERAAAWDAPLMMDQPGKYGSGEIFATPENFERYRITGLLQTKAEKLQQEKRLILLGYGNFRTEHQAAHALLDRLGICHDYRDGPARKHSWHGGWVEEAVELLLGQSQP